MAINSPEIQKSQREVWGARVRNGGLVAALIGLIAHWSSLLAGGAGLIAGGEILRNSGKKPQPKTA